RDLRVGLTGGETAFDRPLAGRQHALHMLNGDALHLGTRLVDLDSNGLLGPTILAPGAVGGLFRRSHRLPTCSASHASAVLICAYDFRVVFPAQALSAKTATRTDRLPFSRPSSAEVQAEAPVLLGAVPGDPIEALAALVVERDAGLNHHQSLPEEFFPAVSEVVDPAMMRLAGTFVVVLPVRVEGRV